MIQITRAANGWQLTAVEDGAPERIFVFQDNESKPDDVAQAESLRECLYEAFFGYVRSKHRAGIVIEVANPKDMG